jgi:hypothetical protein
VKPDYLVAFDLHTHAEVSCRREPDEMWQPFDAAAGKYFKTGKRPTIAETIAVNVGPLRASLSAALAPRTGRVTA